MRSEYAKLLIMPHHYGMITQLSERLRTGVKLRNIEDESYNGVVIL